MVEILKHGQTKNLEQKEFKCEYCGCKFRTDEYEYVIRERDFFFNYLRVCCPECMKANAYAEWRWR